MQITHTSFMTVVNKAQVDAHQPLVTVICGAPHKISTTGSPH